MPRGLHAANEALAFLLELAALAALAWWGFTTGSSLLVRVLLGVGTPLVAVVLWGLFAVIALVNTTIATADRNAVMNARR